MRLRIGLAYNQKPADDAEPPSTAGALNRSPSAPPLVSPDLYAEWDEPATIAAVESALSACGTVIRLEANEAFPARLREARPDIVFNIAEGMHGPNREAHVPAICEFFAIPYSASDPLTLCLALDKARAKETFLARGVRTPRFRALGRSGAIGRSELPGGGPWFVKPLFEGSSKGIPESAFCETREAVIRRAAEIHELYQQPALVEEFLPGREFTVAIMGNGAGARALPIVEIDFAALPAGAVPIYGYEAKWDWNIGHSCPTLESELAAAIEGESLAAFRALGCRDWARVDVRLDAQGAPHVLEINPLPGIIPDPTQNSCFPMAARAAGMSYDDLIQSVLRIALERYGMNA